MTTGFADFADRWTATGAFWIHAASNNGNGTFAAGTWGTGTTAGGSSWEVFGSR